MFDTSEISLLYAYEAMLSIEHGDTRVHSPFNITILTEPVFHATRSLRPAASTVSVREMLAYPVTCSIEMPSVATDIPVIIIGDVSTHIQMQTICCTTAMRKLPTNHIKKINP